MLEHKRYWKTYFICSLLGILVYVIIFGIEYINPMNEQWLLGEGSDLTQHYLGWKAYRASSWQWPIGCTNNLAYPLKTSIIFTDSIPIWAVLFKCLSPFLPFPFQYFGIYGVFCFAMQGLLAAILLKKYMNSNIQIVIGSLFFMCVPVMIDRMYYHTALASHWILLLAFASIVYYDECFCHKRSATIFWVVLAILSVGTHLYITAMCGLILLAYCILDFLKLKKWKSVQIVLVFLSVSVLMVWILGGMNGTFALSRAGLGNYSMNLNGLFNPLGWSKFIHSFPVSNKDYREGFAYLGGGIWILILLNGGGCMEKASGYI